MIGRRKTGSEDQPQRFFIADFLIGGDGSDLDCTATHLIGIDSATVVFDCNDGARAFHRRLNSDPASDGLPGIASLLRQLESMIYRVSQNVVDRIGNPVDYHFVELSLSARYSYSHQFAEVARQPARESRGAREGLRERNHSQFDEALFQFKEVAFETPRAYAKVEALACSKAGRDQKAVGHRRESLSLDSDLVRQSREIVDLRQIYANAGR
jgi:hypothetical protein